MTCFLFYRVDPELRVKVADPALSRDLFPNDYHCLGDSENRPIGWLSPEALRMRQFGAASDVVSTQIYRGAEGREGLQLSAIKAAYILDSLSKQSRLAPPDSCNQINCGPFPFIHLFYSGKTGYDINASDRSAVGMGRPAMGAGHTGWTAVPRGGSLRTGRLPAGRLQTRTTR